MVWARVVMAAAERVGMVLGGTGEAAGKVVALVARGEAELGAEAAEAGTAAEAEVVASATAVSVAGCVTVAGSSSPGSLGE
jgi:hypothetical protein